MVFRHFWSRAYIENYVFAHAQFWKTGAKKLLQGMGRGAKGMLAQSIKHLLWREDLSSNSRTLIKSQLWWCRWQWFPVIATCESEGSRPLELSQLQQATWWRSRPGQRPCLKQKTKYLRCEHQSCPLRVICASITSVMLWGWYSALRINYWNNQVGLN